MGKLDGKIVVITGAARGIGASAARLCAEEGARLVLADMLEEPLRALAEELKGVATPVITDISDEAAVQSLVAQAVQQHGRIDVAMLNAGVSGVLQPLDAYPTEAFDRVMAINARGLFLCLKHVMDAMDGNGGAIVVTSSAAGIRATPNMSAYIASKHAAIGLMRAAAIDGAQRGIRVNSVNPSTIDTPMVHALGHARSSGDESSKAETRKYIPLGRQGTADEVARLMLFLASDDASFCTGGVYMVDGGVSAGRAF